MKTINITTPASNELIRSLRSGDSVSVNGIIVTARDMGHKYLVDAYVDKKATPEPEVFEKLEKYLHNGIIYHCGPVVRKTGGVWEFVSAGPTTSMREEIYESKVMKLFDLAGVIGKGGMGKQTLQGCIDNSSVYLHAIGGAGALIAKNVVRVVDLIKPEFGTPEAFWVIEVKDLFCLVTMDSQGNSLHDKVDADSKKRFQDLVK